MSLSMIFRKFGKVQESLQYYKIFLKDIIGKDSEAHMNTKMNQA